MEKRGINYVGILKVKILNPDEIDEMEKRTGIYDYVRVERDSNYYDMLYSMRKYVSSIDDTDENKKKRRGEN
jgi:hypothetical protein